MPMTDTGWSGPLAAPEVEVAAAELMLRLGTAYAGGSEREVATVEQEVFDHEAALSADDPTRAADSIRWSAGLVRQRQGRVAAELEASADA